MFRTFPASFLGGIYKNMLVSLFWVKVLTKRQSYRGFRSLCFPFLCWIEKPFQMLSFSWVLAPTSSSSSSSILSPTTTSCSIDSGPASADVSHMIPLEIFLRSKIQPFAITLMFCSRTHLIRSILFHQNKYFLLGFSLKPQLFAIDNSCFQNSSPWHRTFWGEIALRIPE